MSGIVAGINAGIALTTMGISAAQKNKAEKNAAQAERAASKAMDEARQKLDVNFQEGRTISRDPYTMAIEQSLAQGAASVQAAQESERGIGQIGRVQMAQNQMAEGQRVALGQELQQLDKDILGEESRLRDVNTQIDLQEAAGAQEAAAMYDEQAAAAKAAMIQSGVDLAAAGASALPLYSQNNKAQQQAISGMQFDAGQAKQFGTATGFTPTGFESATGVIDFGVNTGGNFSAVGDMSGRDFRQFKRNLTPAQKNQIMFDPAYMNQYNSFTGGN